ncbi:MAG: aspartate kinase [Breznakia sp.]
MIKIVKFGGSSLANAKQFKKVKNIIKSDPTRSFVVASACGKTCKDEHKITDLLYLCDAHIKYHIPCDSIFELIRNRFSKIKTDLDLNYDIDLDLDALFVKILAGVDLDFLVSRGEYYTAKLLSEYLGYHFVDAKELIFFHYDGSIDYPQSKQAFTKLTKQYQNFVVPGFYGVLPDQKIKVMSRGGSDISGSILANIVDADVYENWTDVSGILKADPKIIQNPKQIDIITYRELRELSYMGASVLHEDTIYPVKHKNIPIHILNTNDPTRPGTIIIDKIEETKQSQQISGIAGKRDFSILTIQKAHMHQKAKHIKDTLAILEKYNVAIEHLPTGIDSFSIVVETTSIQPFLYDIISEIRKVCKPNDINVVDKVSLIAIVSRFMKHRSGMSGRLFTALGNAHINISIITQTSDEMSIIVGVQNRDYENTVRVLYHEFEGENSYEYL